MTRKSSSEGKSDVRCTHCGGKAEYCGQQEMPPAFQKKLGKVSVGIWQCVEEGCGTSFVDPDDAEAIIPFLPP